MNILKNPPCSTIGQERLVDSIRSSSVLPLSLFVGSRDPWNGVRSRHAKGLTQLLAILCMAPSLMASAQQSSSVSLSALQSSVSGLTGGVAAHDFILQGTANSTIGAKTDSGTFSALCSVNGYGQLQVQLSNSALTETRQMVNGVRTGVWTGSDGTQHPVAAHNLLTADQWYCPSIIFSRIVQATDASVQFVGIESRNGQSLEHFRVTRVVGGNTLSTQPALLSHLTELNIFLDAQTLRPAIVSFNTHPDKNASIDIPVEIRFSSYAQSGGTWYPSQIEKYVNSNLVLDLQVQTVGFNQGTNNPLLAN